LEQHACPPRIHPCHQNTTADMDSNKLCVGGLQEEMLQGGGNTPECSAGQAPTYAQMRAKCCNQPSLSYDPKPFNQMKWPRAESTTLPAQFGLKRLGFHSVQARSNGASVLSNKASVQNMCCFALAHRCSQVLPLLCCPVLDVSQRLSLSLHTSHMRAIVPEHACMRTAPCAWREFMCMGYTYAIYAAGTAMVGMHHQGEGGSKPSMACSHAHALAHT